jgi:hypothetical protein
MHRHIPRPRSLYCLIAGWLVIFPCGVPSATAGELNVSRAQESIIVDAKDVPLAQVLAELRRTINLQYRMPSATSRMITGRYQGSLKQVLARMLYDADYILRSTPEGSVLTVFGRNPEAPIRGPRTGAISPDVPSTPDPRSYSGRQAGEAPQLAPKSNRPPPPTYPNEGMNYPPGTNFGKGL